MCKKWNLKGLQQRDESPNTNTFEHVFSPDKRTSWPDLPPPPTPPVPCVEEDYHQHPVNEFQRSMLLVAGRIAKKNSKVRGQKIRKVNLLKIDTVKGAIDYLEEIKEFVH